MLQEQPVYRLGQALYDLATLLPQQIQWLLGEQAFGQPFAKAKGFAAKPQQSKSALNRKHLTLA